MYLVRTSEHGRNANIGILITRGEITLDNLISLEVANLLTLCMSRSKRTLSLFCVQCDQEVLLKAVPDNQVWKVAGHIPGKPHKIS